MFAPHDLKIEIDRRTFEHGEVCYFHPLYLRVSGADPVRFTVTQNIEKFLQVFSGRYEAGIAELHEFNERTGVFEIPYGEATTYPDLTGYLTLSHEHNKEMTTLFRDDVLALLFGDFEPSNKTRWVVRELESVRLFGTDVMITGWVLPFASDSLPVPCR